MIKIFDGAATDIDYTKSYGYGVLSDVLSCKITEERNGAFELDMTYPADGAHADRLEPDAILFCKARPSDDVGNPFRIDSVSDVINGRRTVKAYHMFYDMNAAVMLETNRTGIAAAVNGINNDRIGADPVRVWHNGIVDTTTPFVITEPRSLAQAVAGAKGSLLDVFGGELGYEYDPTRKIVIATLYQKRGVLLPYTISYGVNMTGFDQMATVQDTYTDVYPIWKGNGTIVRLNAPIPTGASGLHEKVLLLDMSGDIETEPTQAELQAAAQQYVTDNKLDAPRVSINVRFTGERRNAFGISGRDINLCDELNVRFLRFGVETTAKVVKAVYDEVKDRYDELTIGTIEANAADTLAALERSAGM